MLPRTRLGRLRPIRSTRTRPAEKENRLVRKRIVILSSPWSRNRITRNGDAVKMNHIKKTSVGAGSRSRIDQII